MDSDTSSRFDPDTLMDTDTNPIVDLGLNTDSGQMHVGTEELSVIDNVQTIRCVNCSSDEQRDAKEKTCSPNSRS